jgi:folylpolyglutamate synthase/dihydropteroate synthase
MTPYGYDRPSCRMEEVIVEHERRDGGKVKIRCVLDVAHNPQAFQSLFTTLRQHYRQPVIRSWNPPRNDLSRYQP